MNQRRSLALLLCLALMTLLAPATSAEAIVLQKGTYHPLTSARLLDTRSGLGAPNAPLGAGQTLQLTVAGRGSVPTSGVAAVVLNVTVTGATANSFLSVYPSGQTRPTVSSINFLKGVTRANGATVPIGTGGQVAIYNSAGSTEVIVDVLGWYDADDSGSGGNEFTPPATPERLLDTRNDSEGALAGNTILTSYIDFGQGGDLSASVRALALNVTVVNAVGSGYLTAWDGNGAPPSTSVLNFRDNSAVANLTVVKTALCTTCTAPAPVQFAIYNASTQPVHVIVDLAGIYYNDGTVGLRFSPLTPTRIKDSRVSGTALGAAATQTVTAPTTVADTTTSLLVSNVTAVGPTASTYLTLYKTGATKPSVSNLNAPAATTVANGALVAISGARQFNVYNNAGTTNYLVDVTGRFVAGPGGTAVASPMANGIRTFTVAGERHSVSVNR